MKIINTGSVRIRVEGYGYAAPGKSITVPDDLGRQLCTAGSDVSDFREVRKPLTKTEVSSLVGKKSLQKEILRFAQNDREIKQNDSGGKKPARKRSSRSRQKPRASKKGLINQTPARKRSGKTRQKP